MTKSIENLKWRYATKNFNPDKTVTKKQLQTLMEAFNLTATSYGLQPCKMVVVEDQGLREQMVPIAYGQRQVIDASAVLVICTKMIDVAYIESYFELVKKIRQTSDEVLAPFKKQLVDKFSTMEKNEVDAWARNQAYIILGTLMSTCAQERMDSCPMEGFIPEKMDELLDLKSKGLTSVLLLPVGYRADDDMFAAMKKVRLPLSDSIISR